MPSQVQALEIDSVLRDSKLLLTMVVSSKPIFDDSDYVSLDPPQGSGGVTGMNAVQEPSHSGTTPSVAHHSGNVSHHSSAGTNLIDLSSPPSQESLLTQNDSSQQLFSNSQLTTGLMLSDSHGAPLKTSPNSNPSPSSTNQSFDFHRLDMFKGPYPISSSEKTRLLSCRPVDWADSFCSEFHLALDSNPDLWINLCEKFNDVINLRSFQNFLSCDLNGMPLAFIGIDQEKNIRLFHNVLLAPDSGTIVNPVPSFVCLTQAAFDSPPVSLVSNGLVSLFISTEYSNIPTAQKIFDECVSDLMKPHSGEARPADVLPDFRFDPKKFEQFQVPEDDDEDDDGDSNKKQKSALKKATDFEFMGFTPIHPSISGDLLKLFSHFGFESANCSPKALAAHIFHFLVRRWAKSIGRDEFRKATFVDVSHPVFAGSHSLFRFLWLANHKARFFDPLVLDVPSKFDAASRLFRRQVQKAFPDQASPKRSFSYSSALPTSSNSNERQPVNPPPGLPPASLVPHVSHTSVGGVYSDAIYMTQRMTEQLSEVFLKHSNRLVREKDDEKKEVFKNAIHLRNGILFGQVNASSNELPSSPTEIALEVFRQKSTHTLHSLIQARVFRKAQNACYILFSQCGVLQKYGLRWKGDDHPSGFSPFSFDPYNSGGPEAHLALDNDIHNHIYECSLRQDNGLSTKDMRDIFTDEKLFCPLVCDEYCQQLRSYYLFTAAILGNSSFIAVQIHKMVEHYLSHKRLYQISQAYDPKFLTQVLFSIDDAVQRFIEENLESAECLEDISFDSLEYHTNHLCYKIVSRENICRMLPQFFLTAINSQSNKVTPNADNNSSQQSSSKSNKKRNAENGGQDPKHDPSKRVKFDSPKEWCLPPRLKYSRVFPRSVLEKMPTMTVDGVERAFCNKLLSLKSCRLGNDCYFCHADPREHGKGDEVSAFFKKAYADAKKNQS